MAKSNNLSSLLNQLSRGGSRGQGGSASNLAAQADNSGGSGRTLGIGRNNDVRIQGFSAITDARGIAFGKPSNSNTSHSVQSGGSELTSLLKQAASGGIASALGGSFGLGSISGLGSIVSGANLFGGGKKTQPALVEFQLPASRNETLYVGANSSVVHHGTASQSPQAAGPGSGVYNSPEANQNSSDTPWMQDQNGQIAQAVKTALLHSSSLADVIAEI